MSILTTLHKKSNKKTKDKENNVLDRDSGYDPNLDGQTKETTFIEGQG